MTYTTRFAVAVAIVGSALSNPLFGQTKFLWPSDNIDVSKYKYIDVCYAAQARLNDSTDAQGAYKDSLHFSKNGVNRERFATVVAATKRCMQKFTPDQIVAEDFTLAQELYLIAKDDAHAKAIVDRRIQSIANLPLDDQIAHLDTIVETYYLAEPIRLSAAMDVFDRMENMTKKLSAQRQVLLYARLLGVAAEAKQDSIAGRAFSKMIAAIKTMSDAEFVGIPGQQGWVIAALAMKTVYKTRLLECLAKGTKQYLDEPSVIFTELVGRAPPATPEIADNIAMLNRFHGQRSEIHGDYWFPSKPETVTYPRAGVVTLVIPVFEDFDSHHKGRREAYGFDVSYGALTRRLKARWPELEVIFLANTLGWLKVMEPPPPEREAIMLDSMYRNFYKFPGILAVSKTGFWRMPGYDRRRINERTSNQLLGLDVPQVRVIDKEGLMVESLGSQGDSERQLEDLLEVLIKRQPSVAANANAK